MKTELIQASISLFVEKGFSATSIQDIVDKVGVTKGSFYYHFKSKEALLMHIHLSYIDDLLSRQDRILVSEHSAEKKLVRIVELLIRDIEDQGAIGQVYYRELRHLTPENADVIRKKRADFRDKIEMVIQKGMTEGEFRASLDPRMATFAILGITNWSYQWFNPAGAVSADELAALHADLILNGIVAGKNKDG